MRSRQNVQPFLRWSVWCGTVASCSSCRCSFVGFAASGSLVHSMFSSRIWWVDVSCHQICDAFSSSCMVILGIPNPTDSGQLQTPHSWTGMWYWALLFGSFNCAEGLSSGHWLPRRAPGTSPAGGPRPLEGSNIIKSNLVAAGIQQFFPDVSSNWWALCYWFLTCTFWLRQAELLNRERLQRTCAMETSTILRKSLDFTQDALPEAVSWASISLCFFPL